MAATADDNFFIEEPHKLSNNFFSKDKSLQIVELLAQKHHHDRTTTPVTRQQKVQQFHPYSISFMMKKPELKSNSAEHLEQLMHKLQQTLDYREHKAIDWLAAALDDHFVELVKTDDAGDTIDQLSAYVESQCALLREIENTKCLLKPVAELLDNQHQNSNRANNLPTGNSSSKQTNQQNHVRQRIYHKVDYLEF